MLITDFDYYLPPELIAQYPEAKRDEARLLVVDRANDTIYHKKFYDILDYLRPGRLSRNERFPGSAGPPVRRKTGYRREGGISFDQAQGRRPLGSHGKTGEKAEARYESGFLPGRRKKIICGYSRLQRRRHANCGIYL